LQRRRQKLWEEGPAVSLPAARREAVCASAVALARRVAYRGAGTVEYLYDANADAFYFIEMNTRIQVEHPVTEAITGVDLVEAQLRIAGGEKLWLRQDDIAPIGHAIEIRINAEDPDRDFMPSPGIVSSLALPDGARFDTLLFPGCKIVPFYDSLIGKLIVHAADRLSALDALRTALDRLEINGIATNIELFRRLLAAADIKSGDIHTLWLEKWIRANAAGGHCL
jgi:acetyl-CoA carboxylase biotin carboxylase subunit